jgi:3-hydroxyisobutyrate dehydrogenase-like beta-hydroxyacid dehydrogenase
MSLKDQEAESIGILHPGLMGSAIAAHLRPACHRVVWLPSGRSQETARRADEAGLTRASDLGDLVNSCRVILSICPPHAAFDVAGQVAATGSLDGRIFVDANAISPNTARRVAIIVEEQGASYVDAGIIGNPPPSEGGTRVYLSGKDAPVVAGLLGDNEDTGVDVVVMSGSPPAASALKMSYAAWTKGTAALVLAIRAVARHEGVEDELISEWRQSIPSLEPRFERAIQSAITKGWRFAGEMDEIAATFAATDLPDGFGRAAAEIFRRSPHLRPSGVPARDTSVVLDALLSD